MHSENVCVFPSVCACTYGGVGTFQEGSNTLFKVSELKSQRFKKKKLIKQFKKLT